MYLTPYQSKQLKIIIVLLVGIPLTLFAGYRAIRWFTGAGSDTTPRNVVIGNISSTSVTITWTTDVKVTGSVVPMVGGSEVDIFYDKRGTSRRYTHYVELKSLEPSTEYDLKLFSGEDRYTRLGGERLTVTTNNIASDTPTVKPVNGSIEGEDDDVLVYILKKDKSTHPVITHTSAKGLWLLDLSNLRKISDNSISSVDDNTNLIIIAVSGVDNAGYVEGEYGSIFDSNGKLNQTLVATGGEYDSFIPDASTFPEETDENGQDNNNDDENNDEGNNDADNNDGDDPYTSPVDFNDDEIDFEDERAYELNHDLFWIDLVSADGLAIEGPEKYGTETVQITNLTHEGFTVIWYSKKSEKGYAMYGVSPDTLGDKARDERDGVASEGEYVLHSIEFSSLMPETTYYFEIYSGEDVYDNNGNKYEVETFSVQEDLAPFEMIAGSIDVENPQDVVVVATLIDDDGIGSTGSSLPISALVDNEGSWILTIGEARTELGEFFDKSNSDLIEFTPKYFVSLPTVTKQIGEAASTGVVLSSEGITSPSFVKIPLLEEYGILFD